MQILHDVFPAHFVVCAPKTVEDIIELVPVPNQERKNIFYVGTTRVIVTDELIAVASDTPEGPLIVFQEKYNLLYLPDNRIEGVYRVVTESGKMLAFKKDTNCGCGSRLRGWNPYKTLTSQKGVK